MLIIAFSLGACGPTNSTETRVGDFLLTVTVDKTSARVGETVTVTAVFKNLSGKDIPIELTDWQTYYNERNEVLPEIGNILETLVCLEDGGFSHITILMGQRDKMILEKDAVIRHTAEYRIEELEKHYAAAAVYFYLDGDEKKIEIISEPIKITGRR